MSAVIAFVLARLKEPSTAAALAALLALVHVNLTPDQQTAILQAVVGILAALGVFLPESGPKK